MLQRKTDVVKDDAILEAEEHVAKLDCRGLNIHSKRLCNVYAATPNQVPQELRFRGVTNVARNFNHPAKYLAPPLPLCLKTQ